MSASGVAEAFKSRLTAITVPVAWPNVEFTPPAKGMHCEVQLFRNQPERLTINGAHRFPGIVQVTVVAGTDEGTRKAEEQAEEVKALFPVDLKLEEPDGDIRITEAPHIEGGIKDGARWLVPVSIYYEQLGKKG